MRSAATPRRPTSLTLFVTLAAKTVRRSCSTAATSIPAARTLNGTCRTHCLLAAGGQRRAVEQVRAYGLPVNPGKATDSRAGAFVDRHGSLMQVELDALDPETLRELFSAAIDAQWDTSAYEAVLAAEHAGRERLQTALGSLK